MPLAALWLLPVRGGKSRSRETIEGLASQCSQESRAAWARMVPGDMGAFRTYFRRKPSGLDDELKEENEGVIKDDNS